MSETAYPLVQLAAGELHEVPPGNDWLSPTERDVLARLKLEKRRNEWRLGRWLVRHAIRRTGVISLLEDVTIIAAGDGAPEVDGHQHRITISISHRAGMGFAAAAPGLIRLGCDVELIEPRSHRFVADYLTPAERDAVLGEPEEQRALMANLIWSGKEAALKALRSGLRADTRSIEVRVTSQPADERGWGTLRLTDVAHGTLNGWWRMQDRYVFTLAGDVSLS